MDGLWANGARAPAKLTAAIDTGTSLIYVPSALAAAFYALIPGSKRASQYGPGFWSVPCYSVNQIELSFDGNRFAIHPKRLLSGSCECGLHGVCRGRSFHRQWTAPEPCHHWRRVSEILVFHIRLPQWGKGRFLAGRKQQMTICGVEFAAPNYH
ncbi:hypothetical protein H4582DRAFT_1300587 [Lactarius indigo]|nr:hypothetical protein H4582DRAFT_1300587 [Lactarius indigo]